MRPCVRVQSRLKWETLSFRRELCASSACITAFVGAQRDDEVDRLYHSGIRALQVEMQQDPGVVPAGTLLLFVLASIERVGDRAQNIAWKTKDIYGS